MNNSTINTTNANETVTPTPKNYVGLAFSGSMLNFDAAELLICSSIAGAYSGPYERREISITTQLLEEAEAAELLVLRKHISCCNEQHAATLEALRIQTGINIPAEGALTIVLNSGDTLLTFQVTGLPRLPHGRKEYTPEEIKSAKFKWIRYVIL